MSDLGKKISFGFSKLAKKTAIVPTNLNKNKQDDEVNKVEFIDCLEGKSIKLRDPVKEETGPLVIPLTRPKRDNKSIQEVGLDVNKVNGKSLDKEIENISVTPSSEKDNQETVGVDKSKDICSNDGQNKQETLDEIAAREILEELNRKKSEDEERRVFSVPLTSNAPSGEKESTLEDYDNVPVNDFGLAMLRGMGWAPGKGIGKNEKLVAPTLPTLRPKGMGLGADKIIKSAEKKSSNEDLKMVKGSFIRIIAGHDKDAYGQIEGLDDESGRLIVKLALKNTTVSLNEFMVQLVDSNEFKKNSKVINVSKYEEYKKDEAKIEMKSHDSKRAKEIISIENKSSKSESKNKSSGMTRSSSCESEEYSKVRVSSNKHSTDKYKQSQSRRSRSPHDRSRLKVKSHDSSKYKVSSNHPIKISTDEVTKHRSYSSDSSSSASSYRQTYKQKSSSSKRKSSARDRSLSRQRSSSNSSTSDSSAHYARKKATKHKKKKSNSHKYRSRSRSRSPRKQKHKKGKR
ncbi:G-patch domain and KOW motifs-containing protein-like [Macrosteles quadrilineatus]|uniref:G-patch domain and KOW motifs-containing protein-like n=1 Tax=Macrosteles quadrilineatus TaxID=74068 RepID=UPI0023E18B4A|nr:G-patch domain and KOW motifs-containing protein-like [Macrosteles quadrilineatus]